MQLNFDYKNWGGVICQVNHKNFSLQCCPYANIYDLAKDLYEGATDRPKITFRNYLLSALL